MSVLALCGAFVVALTLCVLATMAVENWSQWRVRVRPARATPTARAPVAVEVSEPEASVESAPLVEPAPLVELEPVATEVVHVIEGRELADQLVASLFAAYAASRAPEANRAAAWVCAIDRPPGESGGEFAPGADLRGRPAAAGRLLTCDVDGRCWVTLNAAVDIGRGLTRRPPTCATLAGVASLWAATRAAMSLVADEDVAPIIASVTTLEPQWRGTPAAPSVLELLVACTEAADAGRGLRLQVTLAPFGGVGRDLAPAAMHTTDPRRPPSAGSASGTSAPAADRGTLASSTPRPSQTV